MIYTIIKKEIKAYLASPIFYFVATAFLAVAGFLFYSNIVMMLLFQGSAFTVSLWEYTLNDIRLLLMVLVPYITMRTFAEEKKHGTLELLYTAPLDERAIVLGKFGGALFSVVLIIGCTAFYPVLYAILYPLDVWPVVSGYVGLVLLALGLVSLGLFISSLTEHQIIASGATLGFSFFLWFCSTDLQTAGFVSAAANTISLQKHFYGLQRGVIATKDVLFFIFFCFFFLALTHARLRVRASEKLTIKFPYLPEIRITGTRFLVTGVVWGIFCVTGIAVAEKWNFRFDLTPNKAYTLSPITEDLFKKLKEEIRVTITCENEARYHYEDFLDLFKQLSRFFNYKIILFDKNPVAAHNASLDAAGTGIVEYQGKKVKIDKVNELALAQALYELTAQSMKTIRIYSAESGSEGQHRYAVADADLRNRGYTLVFHTLQEMVAIPEATRLAIVRDLNSDLPERCLKGIEKFFENGGNLLVLIDEGRMPILSQFMKTYNIELGDDIIMGVGNSAFDFNPLIQLVFPNKAHPAFAQGAVPGVFFRARSVQVGTEFRRGYTWAILCQSGRGTWAETDHESIARNAAVFESGRDVYGPVSVGVTIEKEGCADSSVKKGRLAVIGGCNFITEHYYTILGNADLYKKTVEWLASSIMLPIKLKEEPPQQFKANIPMSSFEGNLFFWLFVMIEPALVLLIGIMVELVKRARH